MHFSVCCAGSRRLLSILVLAFCHLQLLAQPGSVKARQFPPGSAWGINDLPKGLLRRNLENLPEPARERALGWLRGIHFSELDADMLRVDADGGVYFADDFSLGAKPTPADGPPITAEAAVPVSPFPASLRFHSRPGAPNVIFLDFDGKRSRAQPGTRPWD